MKLYRSCLLTLISILFAAFLFLPHFAAYMEASFCELCVGLRAYISRRISHLPLEEYQCFLRDILCIVNKQTKLIIRHTNRLPSTNHKKIIAQQKLHVRNELVLAFLMLCATAKDLFTYLTCCCKV